MAQSLDLFYFIFSSEARGPSVEICLGFFFSLPSLSSGLLSSLRVFGNITIHLFFYCLGPLMAFVSRRRKSGVKTISGTFSSSHFLFLCSKFTLFYFAFFLGAHPTFWYPQLYSLLWMRGFTISTSYYATYSMRIWTLYWE